MTSKQLFQLTGPQFQMPFFVAYDGKLTTTPANDIPMVAWPNGRWCFAANMYMLQLFAKGRSRKNGGGTLKTYGASISHLIRYCYDHKVNFIDLNDNQFAEFVTTLTKEGKPNQPETLRRKSNQVIEIGRRSLDFLASVGAFYEDAQFMGRQGRIVAYQKDAEIEFVGRNGHRRKRLQKYWHHRSFPTPDPKIRRLPISSRNIGKLRSAIVHASKAIFLRKRRYAMLKTLEITGGRRSEVAALTIRSVYDAAKMVEPRLMLLTAKRPGGREEYRLVPVARHDLVFLVEFIEKNRRRIVHRTCGLDKDDGYVFVSETTGRKLRPNTITQEISHLAKAAGIVEQTCPHMFRHAFITKLFVALIEQHNIENVDDFRRALLDTEGLKAEIQQWTGHKDVHSLDEYIHLAFAEMVNLKKTLSIVGARRTLESFKASIVQVVEELAAGASASEAAQLLTILAGAAVLDLNMYSEADT